MKALLVLDMQKGILERKDFHAEKELIVNVMKQFKAQNEPIIFLKHQDGNSESPLYTESIGNEIEQEYVVYADYLVEKTTPSAFRQTNKVTLIEDATGTVNDEEIYEMPGLDIKDFVGSVLNWSNVIEVQYNDEYIDSYIEEGKRV